MQHLLNLLAAIALLVWATHDAAHYLARLREHLARLREHTAQSIETSSLHLDLLSDLKRINSLICSLAYRILESAGVLAATRLRESRLGDLTGDEVLR